MYVKPQWENHNAVSWGKKPSHVIYSRQLYTFQEMIDVLPGFSREGTLTMWYQVRILSGTSNYVRGLVRHIRSQIWLYIWGPLEVEGPAPWMCMGNYIHMSQGVDCDSLESGHQDFPSKMNLISLKSEIIREPPAITALRSTAALERMISAQINLQQNVRGPMAYSYLLNGQTFLWKTFDLLLPHRLNCDLSLYNPPSFLFLNKYQTWICSLTRIFILQIYGSFSLHHLQKLAQWLSCTSNSINIFNVYPELLVSVWNEGGIQIFIKWYLVLR